VRFVRPNSNQPEPGIRQAGEGGATDACRNLTAVIEGADDPIWSVGLDFGILSMNRAAQRSMKSSMGLEAPLGARPIDLVSPAEAVTWNKFYQRALTEGTLRVEHKTPAGVELEITFNQIVVNGRVVGISGFGKEIGRRKAIERALVEAERKYHSIFDGALEGMFQTTWEGELLTANPAAIRMLGYESMEDALGTIKYLGQDLWVDSAARQKYLEEVDKSGLVRGLECRFKRKDGTPLWVSFSARKVEGDSLRPGYLEGFIEDITARKQIEQRLLDGEERYRATFEQAAVGIVHCSFEGKILRCNQRFGEILGYSPKDIRWMTADQLTPPQDKDMVRTSMERQLSGAGPPQLETRCIRKDGSLTWVSLTASIQRDAQGNPQHFIAVFEDINARKQAEEQLANAQIALRASEERYRTTFQMSLDAININRLSDGLYIECNSAFLKATGYARDEVIGRTSLELNIWAETSDRQTVVERVSRGSVCRNLEVQFTKKNGDLFWGLISASLIKLDGTACILSVTRDISDAKAAAEEIRSLAFYDPLTHLPNRRLLLERLRLATAIGSRSERTWAILFVDLDDFKTVNDTAGHHTGDLLLQAAASRMSACVREGDTVARLGGDEFVVMLGNLKGTAKDAATKARGVAEKILTALAEPYQLAGHECHCTASVGITLFGGQKESTSEILKQADIAMYQAKAAGRNTMRFFAPELQSAVNAKASLEKELRQGLREGQFALWYQPQVRDDQVVGVEALIRWNHPCRGHLMPDTFIPLAEETGLIVSLGNWVLDSACAQLAQWARDEETAHLSLAVNISVLQLRQPDFVEQVLGALERTGAHAGKLQLEITESMLAHNIDEIIAKMKELRGWGLRFSLDDFGVEYSSLAYLKRLPLDQLKIDRMFVRDILEDATSRAIARSVVSFSRAMGVQVIAEGVETLEQRHLLEEMGCRTFQGYLFSRPLPLDRLHAFLPGFARASTQACSA
jgi:diguanylate cyclase (GGDEF)-like protein/PAS domain S-box-containing protein